MRGFVRSLLGCVCNRSPFLTDFILNKGRKKKKKTHSLSAVVADLAASEHHESLGDSEQLCQEGKGGELGGSSQVLW